MLVLFTVLGGLLSTAVIGGLRLRHFRKLAKRQHEVIGYQRSVLNMYDRQVRDIFKYLPIPMAMVDPDGYIVRCNVEFSYALGYTPDELKGRSFREITADKLDEDLKFFRRLKAGEIDSYRMTKAYWHKHGHSVLAELTAIGVKSAATNKMQYAFGIFIPKTERQYVDVDSATSSQ